MAKNPAKHPNDKSIDVPSGGEMARRIRELDWAKTPLGHIDKWTPALRMMVRFVLSNRFPMLLWWGPQYVSIYNDPYCPILGAKHPWALGQPVSECWKEIWHILRPLIDTPFHGGPATWNDDIQLEINRHGFVEETHFTIAYSPVPDETFPGGIGGVLATVHEITGKVVGDRRVLVLRDLGTQSAKARSTEEACALAAQSLRQHQKDIPFALLYIIDADRKTARLAGSAGVPTGSRASPPTLSVENTTDSTWPLAEAMRSETPQTVTDLSTRLAGHAPPGAWADPPNSAVVVPIHSNKAHCLAGFLVSGISARLQFDESYRDFLNLVSSQIATSIANAREYEEEKKRTEALAEIDRAKTTFFSNVSHEFRTPLTLMLAPLLDTIAQHNGELPPRVTEELTVVHRNGLRLLKLVNALLDFSRIEAGRVKASFVPTDIAAFTAELASVFRSAVEKAGLALQIDVQPTANSAYIDRDMWEKIVLNLISNAFKFTLNGSINVRLTSSESRVFLTVADTGCGIPAEELPRLFERFHRVEGTRGRAHEGTGIGLALVQELVKIHGGAVTVQSEVGRGTTFTVTIPAGKDHLQPNYLAPEQIAPSSVAGNNAYVEEALRWLPDASESTTIGAPLGPDSQLSPASLTSKNGRSRPRVLVVDDNNDMRSYVRRLLADDYDVLTAADGAQALDLIHDFGPALVLSDVMMPNLDGFGLLRAIRSDPALVAIPVILLSARAGEEATLDGVRAGADDYLVKPFSARELLARVNAQIERKRYERDLASAEQRLRTAMAAARMATCEWNPDTDAVQASDTIADVFGLPPGETISSKTALLRLIHPQDIARHRTVLRNAVQRGEGFHSEFRIIRPVDGRLAWLEERGHVTKDPQTRQAHMVSLIIDVSQRKEAEIALRRNEERAKFVVRLDDELHILSDPAEMAMVAARVLAQHFDCDRALYVEVEPDEDQCTVTGEYSPNLPSILGNYRISQYGADYIATVRANRPYVEHDTTRESLSSAERSAFAALRIGSFISSPLFKDGHLVALLVVHDECPRRWNDDEIEDIGLVASRCWESIERARVARALAKSEDRLALSLESAELGTFYCPMPMGPIIWNNKCKEHFWLPPDAEINFDLFYSILHPEDRERTRAAVDRAVFQREPYDIEYRTVAPDGRIRWVRAKGRAFYDAAGSPTRFDGVTLDITELKIAEQRRDHLLAAERAAREAAEHVSRMKDEFLATLSHELRTPLNAILGWAQVLNRGSLDPEDSRQGLEAIERNARSQTQMIEDLLDMSRIISGKVRLDVQTTMLADVAVQAIQSVRPSAEVKGIRLLTVLDPYAGPVMGDPGRLQQVIWNLLTNAIKFTPKGGKIQVVLERVNSHLELSVTDDGDGIDPSFLPHVFERFRQADASTTRRYGGLGLGLNIVKQLVELHGGSVRVKSQGKGHGSTFTVSLPVAASLQPEHSDDHKNRHHPRASSSPMSLMKPPRVDGLRVLLVDDDADARLVMNRILCDGGAIVKTASSVAEAMLELQNALPEIILSDIGMPGEDGYDLIRKVRSLSPAEGGRIPAVALTAFARSEDRQRALLAGYQIHVSKPIEPSELLTVCASIAQNSIK
jgi:PAS domain S-box-containing protein